MKNKFCVKEKKEWQWWVTPRFLRDKPIHRWCIFPHSFTSELVHALIDEWKLNKKDCILDPFCGAGTTLLAAKEKGVPAIGYDLSPFAVFVSRVKLRKYKPKKLNSIWTELQRTINPAKWDGALKTYSKLIKKALPGHLLGAFENINNLIEKSVDGRKERDFFKMALLGTLPKFSRAVATGGWLKWVDKKTTTRSLLPAYANHVELMISDVTCKKYIGKSSLWKAMKTDARCLPYKKEKFSAIITSPPYPNRHDYTRVFGIELMFSFLDWEGTRNLRYQSFESHPESKPNRPDYSDYSEPKSLTKTLERIKTSSADERMPQMLRGYFIDIYLSLREVKKVCKSKAKVAFVVGNAQYGGVPVFVDEFTAEIGQSLGLKCKKILATRYRGNSAQQMSEFGRKPSRESIVIFEKI